MVDNIPELLPAKHEVVQEIEETTAPAGPSELVNLDPIGKIENDFKIDANESDGGDMLKDELAALEQDFNFNNDGNRPGNPFGQSITKELL